MFHANGLSGFRSSFGAAQLSDFVEHHAFNIEVLRGSVARFPAC